MLRPGGDLVNPDGTTWIHEPRWDNLDPAGSSKHLAGDLLNSQMGTSGGRFLLPAALHLRRLDDLFFFLDMRHLRTVLCDMR